MGSPDRADRETARREAGAGPGTGLPLLRRNLRELPGAPTPAAWLAGLVAVLIAYTGPLVLVFQAAEHAGPDRAQLASWIGALAVGSALATLPRCLWYRQPIVVA